MENKKRLSVAICGIRGIPACYGGFETFAEELGVRLAERGHRVVVYGREHVISHKEPLYRGVELRLLPAPRHKYLETPVHTIRSLLDLIRRPVDAVLVCNAANSPFIWLPRLRGMPVAVNLDGIERKRLKWNIYGKAWYLFGELCSVLFATRMVADAEVIREYYSRRYFRNSEVIRYGFQASPEEQVKGKLRDVEPGTAQQAEMRDPVFAEFGLQSGRYILYVSRLEPENNAHVVIAAYNALPEEKRRMPLLIVGDAPYAAEYIAELKAAAGPGVHFAGYRFGDAYRELQQHAYCYVQATEVGGTHPALVEAMGFANCVIANSTPENHEVLGDAGLYYSKNNVEELSMRLAEMLDDKKRLLYFRQAARERALSLFDWDKITNHYEELFYSLVKR